MDRSTMTESVWQLSAQDFPATGTEEEKARFWLQYARLAPSAHNTQPWRVTISGSVVEVFRDPEHTLAVGDPTLRETFLGLGAFIENFIIAAEHWDYRVKVSDLAQTTEDNPIARLTVERLTQPSPTDSAESAELSKSADSSNSSDLSTIPMTTQALFEAITKRHTNRGPYQEQPIDKAIIDQIKTMALPETALFPITDQAARARIAQLVEKGTHIALSMNGMRQELAELVSSEKDARTTGMTIESMVEKPSQNSSASSPSFAQDLKPADEAKRWQNYFTTAPLQVIVGTEYDGPEAWLLAGRVMERLLLVGAANGLAHCHSAAPVEIPTLAPLLRKEIDTSYRPQVLVRIGVALKPELTRPSGRRDLE